MTQVYSSWPYFPNYRTHNCNLITYIYTNKERPRIVFAERPNQKRRRHWRNWGIDNWRARCPLAQRASTKYWTYCSSNWKIGLKSSLEIRLGRFKNQNFSSPGKGGTSLGLGAFRSPLAKSQLRLWGGGMHNQVCATNGSTAPSVIGWMNPNRFQGMESTPLQDSPDVRSRHYQMANVYAAVLWELNLQI